MSSEPELGSSGGSEVFPGSSGGERIKIGERPPEQSWPGGQNR